MAHRILLTCCLSAVVVLSACDQQSSHPASSELKTTTQKASYSFGVDVANRLSQQGIHLDINAFNRGVTDAANHSKLALSEADRIKSKTEFQTQLRDSLIKKQNEIAAKNLKAGTTFLAENAKKPGVITTKSGLQYKILATGSGAQPKPGDIVTTNYEGTLIDGQVFDSSYKRGTPATFPVNGVIKGWTEALQMMHVGDKWQLFIPAKLAYGKSMRSALIQPNSTLIFKLELLSIKGKPKQAK